MKFMILIAAALLGLVAAQGVTDKIAPKGKAPAGCKASLDGEFEVTVATVATQKRDVKNLIKKATCGSGGILVATLSDTVLTDAQARTGYIASNFQFQFDKPAQAGAIYTAGFSICGNNSLALGSSTVFYQCKSGSFWNLYDRNWAEQCEPVEIIAIPCGGGDPPASQVADGQVVATQVITTTVIKPISDGQPQVITTTIPVPICQIGDGQVQAHTTPCASITIVPTTASLPVPVSQFSDGQIQVTPPGTVTAVPATTAAPPATTAAPPATTVVLPTESAPKTTSLVTSIVAASSSSTPAVVASSTPAFSTIVPAAATSAVPASGASHIEMGSLAALFVGLVGAVAFL